MAPHVPSTDSPLGVYTSDEDEYLKESSGGILLLTRETTTKPEVIDTTANSPSSDKKMSHTFRKHRRNNSSRSSAQSSKTIVQDQLNIGGGDVGSIEGVDKVAPEQGNTTTMVSDRSTTNQEYMGDSHSSSGIASPKAILRVREAFSGSINASQTNNRKPSVQLLWKYFTILTLLLQFHRETLKIAIHKVETWAATHPLQ